MSNAKELEFLNQLEKKVLCIKQFAGDPEQYGIDFIEGNIYYIQHMENGRYYVESESGSDVMLTQEEMGRTFITK